MPQNIPPKNRLRNPVTQPGAKQYQRVVSEIDSWILPIASGPFGGIFPMDLRIAESLRIIEFLRIPFVWPKRGISSIQSYDMGILDFSTINPTSGEGSGFLGNGSCSVRINGIQVVLLRMFKYLTTKSSSRIARLDTFSTPKNIQETIHLNQY